jgi:hypothetical protein
MMKKETTRQIVELNSGKQNSDPNRQNVDKEDIEDEKGHE